MTGNHREEGEVPQLLCKLSDVHSPRTILRPIISTSTLKVTAQNHFQSFVPPRFGGILVRLAKGWHVLGMRRGASHVSTGRPVLNWRRRTSSPDGRAFFLFLVPGCASPQLGVNIKQFFMYFTGCEGINEADDAWGRQGTSILMFFRLRLRTRKSDFIGHESGNGKFY